MSPIRPSPVPPALPDTDRQAEAIAFLKTAAHFPGDLPPGTRVVQVVTHGAHVFLAGATAYKIKRAVRYDYLDFSTLAQRERMLRRELKLNAAAAPEIYQDVVPLTRAEDGTLALDGPGTPVEWVLRMNRFPRHDEMLEIARSGALDTALARRLGRAVAAYHDGCEIRGEGAGAVLIAEILDELDTVLDGMGDRLGHYRIVRFLAESRRALAVTAPVLEARAGAGQVRRCHGDLHLSNLVMIDGRPVLYDALEFDERLGTCDTLYDLAFLIMDLWHRDLRIQANAAFNAYLDAAPDGVHDEGIAALPLFLAVRAAIRAMTGVQTAAVSAEPARLIGEARAYLEEAVADFAAARPVLIAIGGLSGTGKTTLAQAIAPEIGRCPGAVHLLSDVARKRMLAVDPQTPLPDSAYDPAMSARVYAHLRDRARTLLEAGQGVILDATHLAPETRRDAQAVAVAAKAEFCGIWLTAPLATALSRVAARPADASDADAAVVHAQARIAPTDTAWDAVDTSGSVEEALTLVRQRLRRMAADGGGSRADPSWSGTPD